MAGVAAAGAIAFTAGAEDVLPSFGFHGMAGFLAVALVALSWGIGPAALVALVDAVALSFLVAPQEEMAGRMPGLGHGIGFVSSLAFGLTVATIASLAEARRRELAKERAELAAIFQTAPQALTVWDRAGYLVRANHQAEEHLGAQIERLQAMEFTCLLRHLDGTPLRQGESPLTRAQAAGETMLDEQYLLHSAATGGTVPVLLNTASLYDDTGNPSGVLLTLHGISAIKAFEQQREEFWAMVTHDLKNPLTTVCCASQLLQRDVQQLDETDRGRMLRTLDILQSASQRMLCQVTDVLEREREECGQPTMPRQSADILPQLKALVDEYDHGNGKHTVELHATVGAARCLADPRSLERAFANLLDNAIKYSPDGGHIGVSVSRSVGPHGPWLDMTFQDEGIGIPRANLPHVAELFYRAPNVVGMIAGSGVGLAGARRVVEQHGGTLSISSTEGAGTAVTIRLPECSEPASIAG